MGSMYVCVCNAITDRDLAGVAREGVGCAKEAFRRLGGAPVCGRCLDFAQTVIDGAGERTDPGVGGPALMQSATS